MKTGFTLTCLVLLGLFTASCVSNKKFKALQDEKDALSETLAQVESKVKMLEEQNEEIQKEKNELSNSLSQVQTQLTNTEREVSNVKSEMTAKQRQLDALRAEVKAAFSGVEDAVTTNFDRLSEIEDRLYIDMDDEDKIKFNTASARVHMDDQATLEKLANMLNKYPDLNLVVEGHTDKRSISNEQYRDNWDLSAARSINVVRKLINMGVNPDQLTAAGRGEYMPVDEGESREAYAKNRRVELIVLPKIGTLYKMEE